ncbi:hypothetical protein N7453_011854 [Penicillium expansum]|nr:hypothetical protein N7453_011854 [Penicillium expansum]
MKNAKPWISRRLNYNLPAPTNVDPDQEWLDPEVIPSLQKIPSHQAVHQVVGYEAKGIPKHNADVALAVRTTIKKL